MALYCWPNGLVLHMQFLFSVHGEFVQHFVSQYAVFQLGNEKGRAPGRALWAGRAHFRALWAREGTLSENKLCNCEKVIILLS